MILALSLSAISQLGNVQSLILEGLHFFVLTRDFIIILILTNIYHVKLLLIKIGHNGKCVPLR
ncbi:hypothetical protein VSVS12_04571 (plasmid) [Vibrio scophthalmi]|nr:hypothetical protein VSVS12_04543 [Vibrio scophthalmi]ANS88269.1 hypothetical protein VSVS12_04571 [Vibrio scophthalmi]